MDRNALGVEDEHDLVVALAQPERRAVEGQERAGVVGTRNRVVRLEAMTGDVTADHARVVELAADDSQFVADDRCADRLAGRLLLLEDAPLVGIDAVETGGFPGAEPKMLAITRQRLGCRRW